MELLANSNQVPQEMPTITCQSRVKYGQPSKITNVSLFYDVMINHTLRKSYTFKIHINPFSWTINRATLRQNQLMDRIRKVKTLHWI